MRNVEGALVSIAKKLSRILIARGLGDFDDALQETRLAFEAIRETTPREYWYRSTLYAARAAMRKRYKTNRKYYDARAEGGSDEERLDVAERVEVDERVDVPAIVRDELAKLPEKWRRIFVARYIEGKTPKECAAEFGLSYDTIVTYCYEGRKIIRGETTLEALVEKSLRSRRRRRERDPETFRAKERAQKASYKERKGAEIREKQARYYRERRDELLAIMRRRREKNGDAIRAREREWYAANRERILAWRRAYEEKNRERIRAQHREWDARNREKKNERERARYAEHREEISAKRRERRAEINERCRRWREANRERSREYARERYARKKAERETAARDPGAKRQTQPNEERE